VHIETQIFGTIEVGESTPYIKRAIQVNGRPENCGLYIADEFSKHTSHYQKIAEFIDRIDFFDTKARDILFQEFQNGNALVVDFLDFHLEECEEEIKAKLQVSTIDRKLLLQRLDLRAIGFDLREAEDAIEFGFDYCPGENFTGELLVVKFNESGNVIEVAHES